MRKFSREARRHHVKRLKKNRRHYWGNKISHYDVADKILGQLVTTPHPCSSYCCGNPRKHFKELTLQELRFNCIDVNE